MKKKPIRWKPERILRLPDLDHAKTAVLNTLGSPDSERSYRFAIDDFIAWHCSEPRLAFNKTVVLRYRLQLEARRLSASTINVRLAAVRRLTYEAADSGLLSPELAASIRRVKGAQETRSPARELTYCSTRKNAAKHSCRRFGTGQARLCDVGVVAGLRSEAL
jgi:hypothetical protein